MKRNHDHLLVRYSALAILLTVLSLLAIGCSGRPREDERRQVKIQTARAAIIASNAGDHEPAAVGFAEIWLDASEADGGPEHSGGTYVLAQYRELRESFRSDAGRPIANALLDTLRHRVDREHPHRHEVESFIRLAAILERPEDVASVVESRQGRGWARRPLRPAIGILLAHGRTDLASWLEPTPAERAGENLAQGAKTAGLIVATAPVTVPMLMIATSGPIDFPYHNAEWTDPIRPEDR